jgi:hypothetical protein
VSALVAVSVVAGFLALGSPQEERRRRLDEVRVTDLMGLRNEVAGHFDRTGRLPASLSAIERPAPRARALVDPATAEPYEYVAIDDSSFRLCATFDHETEAEAARFAYLPWAHRAGRQCYRFRIGRLAGPDPGRELVPLPEDAPVPPR